MNKKITFKVLEEFFKDYSFDDDKIEISPCETVLNVKTCVSSHIAVISANRGKEIAAPYYYRLLKIYKILNAKINDK